MSYDMALTIDDLDVLPYWNYTGNVAPMWRAAMPETGGLAGMHGMRAGEAAEHLARGIERMQGARSTYEAMNPANGWGCFDGENGQLDRLRVLLRAFRRAPDARVEVSR